MIGRTTLHEAWWFSSVIDHACRVWRHVHPYRPSRLTRMCRSPGVLTGGWCFLRLNMSHSEYAARVPGIVGHIYTHISSPKIENGGIFFRARPRGFCAQTYPLCGVRRLPEVDAVFAEFRASSEETSHICGPRPRRPLARVEPFKAPSSLLPGNEALPLEVRNHVLRMPVLPLCRYHQEYAHESEFDRYRFSPVCVSSGYAWPRGRHPLELKISPRLRQNVPVRDLKRWGVRMSGVTRVSNGDARATDEFLPLVYGELCVLVAQMLPREASDQTLDRYGFSHGRKIIPHWRMGNGRFPVDEAAVGRYNK